MASVVKMPVRNNSPSQDFSHAMHDHFKEGKNNVKLLDKVKL